MTLLEKAVDARLKEYCDNDDVRARWRDIIINRAVRFYLNNQLDAGVAEEDLYRECKNCGNEAGPNDDGVIDCETLLKPACGKTEVEYSNLDYSERTEQNWMKEAS